MAYVARVCTQCLVNEYFVVCIRKDEIIFIDPITGRGYIVFKEGQQDDIILQNYVTKVIVLFDSKEIFVNLQPDLSPCFTNFDL